jgi:hypothetical protein
MTGFSKDVSKYCGKGIYFWYDGRKKIAYGPVLVRKNTSWKFRNGISIMIGDIKNGVFVGTAYMTLDIATFKKEMKRISKADLGMRILASYE